MRILAIGDFHGTFQKKFYKIIDKEKIDLVVSNGDYPPFHYRKLWFKHCYGKDIELWEVIGKEKYRKLVVKDLKYAEKPLKILNNLPIPVFTVLGNIDYPSPDDILDYTKKRTSTLPNFDEKYKLIKLLRGYSHIQRFDYSYLKFKDYIFIGMRGHSAPGRPKNKAFKKHKKILSNIFHKFKKENKNGKVIFVSHNIAFNTRLDKISKKILKKVLKGHEGKNLKKKEKIKQHYGSILARVILDKYHPLLHIGGHIHEGMGKQKLGKSWLVNPGSAHEGKAAIIDLDEGKIKKIKFVR